MLFELSRSAECLDISVSCLILLKSPSLAICSVRLSFLAACKLPLPPIYSLKSKVSPLKAAPNRVTKELSWPRCPPLCSAWCVCPWCFCLTSTLLRFSWRLPAKAFCMFKQLWSKIYLTRNSRSKNDQIKWHRRHFCILRLLLVWTLSFM